MLLSTRSGLKIRLHILKTIPSTISPTTHKVNVLIAFAIALVTAKAISATHISEITPDRIVTISFMIPLANPLFTLHINRRKIINTKINLNIQTSTLLS